MVKQKINEIRGKTLEELKKLLNERKNELIKAQSERLGGQEKNLKKVKNLRLEIARISTIIREKEIVESING